MAGNKKESPATARENRDHPITVRFTKAERESLENAAATTQSRKLSDYIRKAALRRKIQVVYRNRSMDDFIQELSLLRTELSAIGNNFNQVTKKVNATAGKNEFPFWVKQASLQQENLLTKIDIIQSVTEKFAAEWYAK